MLDAKPRGMTFGVIVGNRGFFRTIWPGAGERK